MSGDRLLRAAGLVAAVAAALGTLVVDNDLESTLFMAAAVLTALAVFDVSLDRHAAAFWPWTLVTAAILGKTIPSIAARLFSQAGAGAERSLHLGSVLFGLCLVTSAVLIVGRPGSSRGSFDGPITHLSTQEILAQTTRWRPIAAVMFAGLTAGLAGAAYAFAGRGSFATLRAARVLETLGWGSAGAVIMGVAIAATLLRRPTVALVLLGVAMVAGAVLVARVAAGQRDDLGLWALVFVGLASGAFLFNPASLGTAEGHQRTIVPTIVAIGGAILAAVAAVVAQRGDASIGLVIATLLAAAGLSVSGLALRTTPVDLLGPESRADQSIQLDADSTTREPIWATDPGSTDPGSTDPGSTDPGSTGLRAGVHGTALPPTPGRGSEVSFDLRGAAAAPNIGAADRIAVRASAPSASRDLSRIETPTGASAFSTALGARIASERAGADVATASPSPSGQRSNDAAESPSPEPSAAPSVESPSTEASEASPSSASAASATPVASTEVPRDFIDPRTGVQSAEGLQLGLNIAFSRPRDAGEVSLLMISLNELPLLEHQQGRIITTQAIAALATRLQDRLPDQRVARFAIDGFAVLFDGPVLEAQPLIEQCTSVLLDLLDPVRVGTVDVSLDVAAGMAQCYTGEDLTSFLARANQGLAQAVASGEPTLIAMP